MLTLTDLVADPREAIPASIYIVDLSKPGMVDSICIFFCDGKRK